MDKAYVREGKKKSGNMIVSILKGLLVSAAVSCATIFLFCAVAMKFDDPIKTAPIFGSAAMLLASFFGGLFSAKFNGGHGAATGALFGVFYVLAVALVSLICGARITTAAFAVLAPAAVLIAVLGGAARVGKKSAGKKRKKRSSSSN